MSSVVTVRDVMTAVEDWAPRPTAMSYDNVGLQVGRSSAPVTAGLVALDLTPSVCAEARAMDAGIVVTHHPVLFRPLRALTDERLESAMLLEMAEAGIAVYAAHTNLDAARGGVSFALAETLGLEDVRFLAASEDAALRKLVVYVPAEHLEAVRTALSDAGAGRIGTYEACAFAVRGNEFYRPGPGSRPAKGDVGRLTRDTAFRLEVDVPAFLVDRAVHAARSVHPYEEMAYDVYAMERADTQIGVGALGLLPEAMPLSAFLDRVSATLGVPAVRVTGDADAAVRRVAVCGGSGSSFIGAALRAGADAFVTGDVKYHQHFDVLDAAGRPRMALIDAGHYETEAMTEDLLVSFLASRLPSVAWRKTASRTSPVRVHVGPRS